MEKNDPEPFDCFKIQCDDACCQYGVDVWETERDNLIRLGLATEQDFLEREVDEEGLVCYRTAQGNRGCTFLNPDRGCRLYPDHKPSLCYLFPRNLEEVLEAHEDGYLPCVEKYKAIFQAKKP